jgi:HD-GYP domain-containing protein (c-di-GMP phosphodiesterase class II)
MEHSSMSVDDKFSNATKNEQIRNSSTPEAEATTTKGRRKRKRVEGATRRDRKFARLAIEQARKSISEDDGRPHPMVGAVLVKNGKVLAASHRGEVTGNHAEYLVLEKLLAGTSVVGATVYTTLEPCTTRNHPKVPCVERLIERKVARVVIGMLDPNPKITGQGQRRLRKSNIVTDLFPHDLMSVVEELNREFTRAFDPISAIPDAARSVHKLGPGIRSLPTLPGRQLSYPEKKTLEPSREYLVKLRKRVDSLSDELLMALQQLERSYDLTLEVLGGALDLSAVNLPGHSKRVTAYSIAIARVLNIRKDEMDVIARGAFLHGVVRFGVPHSILKKRPPLKSEDISILSEHCVRGYRMLKRIPFLQDVAEIVYAQYECYDGTGYPRGLKGEETPIGARIFHVANALEFLTTETASSIDDARDNISKLSMSQFDPEIVSAFLAAPPTIWGDLRSQIDRQSP